MENKKLIVKPKKPKGEDGHKVFSIRIKDEIVTKLEEICARTGHSRNELISMFLEYALENCETYFYKLYKSFKRIWYSNICSFYISNV